MRDKPWRVDANIEELKPYSPGKPIGETKREYNLDRIVKLASNENPLGPSPKAIAAIGEALGELHRYPDGASFDLRDGLSRHLGFPADQIFLGNGSNEILELLLRTFVNPGEEILTAWPSFVVYPLAAKALRIPCRMVPLREMAYDLPAMAAAVTQKTRMVIVANPNNPTGTMVGRAEVETFLAALPPGVLAVFDEAYREYVVDPTFPDTLSMLKAGDDRIVVARTFSKIYGLAGLRIGYAVAHPKVVDYVNRVRQPFNVNSLAQTGALAALDDAGHVATSVRMNREGIAYLTGALSGLGLACVPTQANFLLFRVGPRSDAIYIELLKRGVIVRPVGGYDLAEYLRVTVGTREENETFVRALTEVLSRVEKAS